jgi:hypothetical protein
VLRGLKREARPGDLIGAAAARGMSRPTPTVLILVGIGLALFVLRIFGIGWLQYRWVLALSICLVAFGLYLYVIVKRPNQN